MRDYKLYLEDILPAIRKIEKYTHGLAYQQFPKDELVLDAVIRNLEIIGEAARNLLQDIKKRSSAIEWKKLSGLRNILIHEYFGVDREILWDIVSNKIPELKKAITGSLSKKK